MCARRSHGRIINNNNRSERGKNGQEKRRWMKLGKENLGLVLSSAAFLCETTDETT